MMTDIGTQFRKLTADELDAVSGGEGKPPPGSTGSPDLDKALDKAKASIGAWVAIGMH
jgi:hypothetical protein